MKIFFLILIFITISSENQKLTSIKIQFNNANSFQIVKKGESVNYAINEANYGTYGFLPQKYFYLLKGLLIRNIKFNCISTDISIEQIKTETFYCINNHFQDLTKIKLNFTFDNYILSLTEKELFEIKNNNYYFKFHTFKDLDKIIFIDKSLNETLLNNNKFIRKLEGERNNEENNKSSNNDNSENKDGTNNNQNVKKNNNSGIGWLGICIIILLSVIILYAIFVGFRYYKRKKYQNPSFYYKITEEMFEDITPIE